MNESPVHNAPLRKEDVYAVDTFTKLPTAFREIGAEEVTDPYHSYRSRNMSRPTTGYDIIVPMSAQAYGSYRRPIKTALHQAILDCRIYQVRLLVEKHSVDVDAQDKFGRTPLMLACLLENEVYGYQMAKLFIKSDCYINMCDNMGRSALQYACMKGRVKMVKKLLNEDNIDIGCQDNDGNNALMHAALSGSPQIVQLVVEKVMRFGLPIDERNALGYTAFLLACKFGHYVSAYYLLFKGGSQADIRDLECNMSARDWVKASARERTLQIFSAKKSKTMTDIPLGPIAFNREHTMYPEQENTPECRHIQTAENIKKGISLGSALRLPDLFKDMGAENEMVEKVIKGRDAKSILLRAIDETVKNRQKFRKPNNSMLAVSRLPTANQNSRCTSTAATLTSTKLREFVRQSDSSRKKHKTVTSPPPDLMMLFKLYSDKYVGVDAEGVTRGIPPVNDDVNTPQEGFPQSSHSHHVRFTTGNSYGMDSPIKTGDASNISRFQMPSISVSAVVQEAY